jgi:SET domain-containing protein
MPYLTETWFDPRLATAPSDIHGNGLVAAEPIAAGEVVMVWGGTLYTRDQLEAGEVPPCSFSFIDDDVLMAAPEDGMDYFVNHSCNPNIWMQDDVTVVARLDIARGEEIAGDYAVWEAGDSYVLEPCNCGAETCRGRMTGRDWQRPELQQRYAGHFLPYIERRF